MMKLSAAVLAAMYIFALTPKSGSSVADVLTFGQWTDEATGSVALEFDSDGSGALDGRIFSWSEDENGASLQFRGESAVGGQEVITLLPSGESVKLRVGEQLYIPGQAVTADDMAALLGQEIAQYALQFEGFDYLYGGKTPETGFDCSGLVYYVYEQFGYGLNRIAADQAKNGVAVDPEDIRAGDILCFKSGSSITHAGIYLGDGLFIHAQSSDTGVVITELEGNYSQRGFEARRIVGQEELS